MDKLKESTYTKFRVKLVRTKDKEKSLESSKREKRPYLIKNNSSDRRFLLRNHGSQKEVGQHFQELKENCPPRILYPVKISFRNEEDIKISPDEGKLREPSPADLS